MTKLDDYDDPEFDSKAILKAVDLVKKELNDWRNVELNLAIVGMSGSGKSTLINTLRGLEDTNETVNDKNVAKTGIHETTLEPRQYTYIDNEKMSIWDLPGIDTPNFSKCNYFDKIEVEKYDCFLICYDTRFHDTDIWLAKEIKKLGKSYFLVRNKIDKDFESIQRKRRLALTPEEENKEIEKTKEISSNYLKEHGLPNQKIYAISSLMFPDNRNKWDLPKLREDIIKALPEEKKNNILKRIQPLGMQIIKETVQHINDRSFKIAYKAGLNGLFPIPFTSVILDSILLNHEIHLYQAHLGLTSESLKELCHSTDANLLDVKQMISQKIDLEYRKLESMSKLNFNETRSALLANLFQGPLSYEILKTYFLATAAMTCTEVSKCVPIFGSVVGSYSSYYLVKYALNEFSKNFEWLANEVFFHCTENLNS